MFSLSVHILPGSSFGALIVTNTWGHSHKTIHLYHLFSSARITFSIASLKGQIIQFNSRFGINEGIKGLPTLLFQLKVIINQLPHASPDQ